MFERKKLKEIADGKRPFPTSEEEFAAMLEAVDDEELYQRVLVAALVQSNQMALDTLKEGGIVPTPMVIARAKIIRDEKKRQSEAAQRKTMEPIASTRSQAETSQAETPPPRPSTTEMPPPRPPVAIESPQPNQDLENKWIYEVESITGQVMYIYDDRIELTHKGLIGFLTQGLQGTKTYYYSDISTIQFKNCGWTSGFFEFTFPGSVDQQGGALFGINNDNRFTFGAPTIGKAEEIAKKMALINEFLQKKIREAKNNRSASAPTLSAADEIKKFKELFDQGIISQDEFEAKKKQLLGL